MNKRNNNLDFLKVIAAFSVVWLHVSAGVVVFNPDVYSSMWWTGNIADSFSRWGVPVFVMISGALLFTSSSKSTPINFYKQRASRLFPPIFFWTLVYIAFRGYTESQFDLTIAAKSIIKGVPFFHFWYAYMILGLYLTVPFLRLVVSGADSDSLRLLVIGCFAIGAIEAAFSDVKPTHLLNFPPFIGYFLAGPYLLNKPGNVARRLLVCIFVMCGSIIATTTGILFPILGSRSWDIMYDYLNPVVVVMSLCIFQIFTNKNINKVIPVALVQRIVPITLGIYFVHPLWLMCLAQYGVTGFMIHPIVGIPVTTLLAFTLSSLSSMLLAIIPIFRRSVN